MKNHMKLAVLALSAALSAPVVAMAQNAGPGIVAEGETPIRITVGDVVMTGRFNSTTMAQRMVERLPVTLTFGNHSGGDDFPTKVTHLDPELPTEGTKLGGAPGTGDIAHYVPNGNFGFYYGQLKYWPGVVTLGPSTAILMCSRGRPAPSKSRSNGQPIRMPPALRI